MLETTARQSPQKATIYPIKRGDTLSRIIYEYYKAVPNTLHYRVVEASILEFNQHIKHPDKIYVGNVLRLMPIPNPNGLAGRCLAPEEYYQLASRVPTRHRLEPMHNDRSARIRDIMPSLQPEQEAFELLSALENNHGLITAAVGGGVNAFGNLVGQGNSEVIREITQIYDDYREGKMTQNQYNYRRQKVIKDLAHRMGPIFRREKLYIDRRKGVIPTARIERHASRIAKLSRYASRGGVVLAGVGVAMSCRDIANTDNQQEKNEIFVETVAGTAAGFLASGAIFLVMVSNPVGWGMAIALGVGAAAAGYTSGKVARSAYSLSGESVDFVSGLGVDKVCK